MGLALRQMDTSSSATSHSILCLREFAVAWCLCGSIERGVWSVRGTLSRGRATISILTQHSN